VYYDTVLACMKWFGHEEGINDEYELSISNITT